MVTRAKDADWGELIDFENELRDWLAARGVTAPEEDALSAAVRVHRPEHSVDPVICAVTDAIYQIATFIGAGERKKPDKIAKRLVEAGLDPDAAKIMTDDSVEREIDRAIRGLTPTLEHIRRRVSQIVERRLARAKVRREQPNLGEVDILCDAVVQRVDEIKRHVDALHTQFLWLAPCMAHEEVTLSGCRRFEKQLRESLRKAGYRSDASSKRP
jgi:hypothetical protein